MDNDVLWTIRNEPNTVHHDLFNATGMELRGHDKIVYHQVILHQEIPGFAVNKEFDLVVLDLLKGTLSFYRDYVRYEAEDPNVVCTARLTITGGEYHP